ncbi:MAG: DinB family protein [Tepidisphaeraceae bacterium]
MTSTLSHSIRPATLDVVAGFRDPEPPAVALSAVIEQLQAVVATLRDEQYTMRPVGVVDSSIGGHVRHCLDHVRALLSAIETGTLDYDHRERGTPIETDRAATLNLIRAFRNQLDALPDDVLDRALRLSVLMTSDGLPMLVGSTVGREMAYVLSHTVHHNALIGTMVKILGGWLPDRFGYAPSTLAHLKGKTCVR